MAKQILALLSLSLWLLLWPLARADEDGARFPRDATFSTLVLTPFPIEGLTGDDAGNLYTTGRPAGQPCPVWRAAANDPNPALITVGFVPAPYLRSHPVMFGSLTLARTGASTSS
jgi:hypothetical protein